MKRKFIALAIAGCLISAWGHAQIRKGSLLFGGSIGYTSNNETDHDALNSKTERKISSLLLSPSFAIGVTDNFFAGVDLTWRKLQNEVDYSSGLHQEAGHKTIGGGIFVRKYWSIVDKLYIFGQGRLGYESFKTDNTYDGPTNVIGYTKGDDFEASVYPGLSFALSKKVHIESIFWNLLSVQYTKGKDYSKAPNNTDIKTRTYNDFDVSSSFSSSSYFTLGIKVLLSK